MEYLNQYHNANYQGSQPYYNTDGYPLKEYRGYLISKRSDIEYHIIYDEVCVGMMAGPRGARDKVDILILENERKERP